MVCKQYFEIFIEPGYEFRLVFDDSPELCFTDFKTVFELLFLSDIFKYESRSLCRIVKNTRDCLDAEIIRQTIPDKRCFGRYFRRIERITCEILDFNIYRCCLSDWN